MRWVLSIATMLLLGAGDPPTTAPADDAFVKLKKEFDEAQGRWYEVYKKNFPSGEMPPRPEIEFRPKFEKYAKEHEGKPAAIPALVWLATAYNTEPGWRAHPSAYKALAKLTTTHASQPEVGDALPAVRQSIDALGRSGVKEFIEAVIETNADPVTRSRAECSLAILYYEGRTFPRPGDSDSRRALKLFRKVLAERPDTPYAKLAKSYIFEIEKLQIGMIAPDIVGEDADGNEIKLSSFRGQVVVLDFWGFW
jgi:hypothetical protein